jgi:hypothetical protein
VAAISGRNEASKIISEEIISISISMAAASIFAAAK